MARFSMKDVYGQFFVFDGDSTGRAIPMCTCTKASEADMIVKALNDYKGEIDVQEPTNSPLIATHRLKKPFRDISAPYTIRRGAKASLTRSRVVFLDRNGNIKNILVGDDSRAWFMIYDRGHFDPIEDWFEELN